MLTTEEAQALIESVHIDGVTFKVVSLQPVMLCKMTTTAPSTRSLNGTSTFDAPFEIDLGRDENYIIKMCARMWLEYHVHEVCELFRVDGKIWMDPHTEDGYIRFLEVKNLKVGRMQFGEWFQARGTW